MSRMDMETIHAINTALFFSSSVPYKTREMKMWQYNLMGYERNRIPGTCMTTDMRAKSQAWQQGCPDERYNAELKNKAMPAAV